MDALLAAMQREADKQRKAFRLRRCMARLHLLCIAVCLIGVALRKWNAGLGGLLGIFNLIPMGVLSRLDSDQRKGLVRRLAKSEEVRAIGPMCNVLSFTDPLMRKMAGNALTRLLPRLPASDAVLLNSEQRNLLFTTLESEDAGLVLATLKALEQIGNAKALPYVERLASGKNAAKTNLEVRQAAVECLPFLRQRIDEENVAGGLLRPFQPATDPYILLRPAGERGKRQSQHLLRAASKEERESPARHASGNDL